MIRDSRGLLLTRDTEFVVYGQMQAGTVERLDDEVAAALALDHLIPYATSAGDDWIASAEYDDLSLYREKLVATHAFYNRLFGEGGLQEEEHARLTSCTKDILRHVLIEQGVPMYPDESLS